MIQQEFMRRLYDEMAGSRTLVVEAFAQAVERGEIERGPSYHDLSPHEYACTLWMHGVTRGWLARR